ncbi:MAG: AAA family ATPase [Micrococcales bacterium]|nr:AAA family ATPase [Micrococcales bacterium]
MRDDEIRKLLTTANPWWNAAAQGTDPTAWASAHRLLLDRREYDLGYRATVLDDVATTYPDGRLVVLTGPRRVGKSAAMLDAITRLCGRPDLDPRQIVNVQCDGMSVADVRRVLTLGRALTSSVDQPSPRPRVWFFDEISGVPGWSTALKVARDLTDFGRDTVVATGSRWVSDEDIQGNLLAGRAGKADGHRVRQLLPMTFRDYITATRSDLALPRPSHPTDLMSPDVRRGLERVMFLVDDYDLAWQDYLTCGGFPRAAAEHATTGGVSQHFVDDLLAWLRRDVDPDALPESVPLLLAQIAARATSPLNRARLAQTLGYLSRQTLDLRITRLANSHAVVRCHQRHDDGARVVGAQYKLYLVDPLLAWLPSRTSAGLDEPDFTALSEATVGIALARVVEDLDEGRWADDTIGYTRTGSGGEVDFAPVRIPTAAGPARTIPVESKWVGTRWAAEARTIQGKYGHGILATKSVLDLDGDVWAVPAPLVALLLG